MTGAVKFLMAFGFMVFIASGCQKANAVQEGVKDDMTEENKAGKKRRSPVAVSGARRRILKS